MDFNGQHFRYDRFPKDALLASVRQSSPCAKADLIRRLGHSFRCWSHCLQFCSTGYQIRKLRFKHSDKFHFRSVPLLPPLGDGAPTSACQPEQLSQRHTYRIGHLGALSSMNLRNAFSLPKLGRFAFTHCGGASRKRGGSTVLTSSPFLFWVSWELIATNKMKSLCTADTCIESRIRLSLANFLSACSTGSIERSFRKFLVCCFEQFFGRPKSKLNSLLIGERFDDFMDGFGDVYDILFVFHCAKLHGAEK